jgi:hypothetical protein
MTDSSSSDQNSTSYETKFNPDDYLKSLYTEHSPIYEYNMRDLVCVSRENAFHILKDGKALNRFPLSSCDVHDPNCPINSGAAN